LLTILKNLNCYFSVYKKVITRSTRKKENEDGHLATIFDFSTITNATNNFSIRNKLGEVGFGPVYKVYSWSLIS
jgi:hypothetical protein